MKIALSTLFLPIVSTGYGFATKDSSSVATPAREDANNLIIVPQDMNGEYAKPEELPSMPQCIAQQDQSAWLSAMTACTWKRCTRHFGVICTQHEYHTQLSCLGTELSPQLISSYISYCSRSVLAKAQLYQWILNVVGRTWLVEVGDAIEVQSLSPASLEEGYARVDVTRKAPTCFLNSESQSSKELFKHAMTSCSFTSTTQHYGNAARPWEYSEHLQSVIALDFESSGYTLTGSSIAQGEYFDRACFCKTFTFDAAREPCLASLPLDFTIERLWMNATCGPRSLPEKWADKLRTTESAYIPTKHWIWPACQADMPKNILKLTNRCAADACELDSDGYCKVTPAIDRSCFCDNIAYDSCVGSCHYFENRIDYVKWMHRLCKDVEDWQGLPGDWRRLAAPTIKEMLPWHWTMAPANFSNGVEETCASSDKMHFSLFFLNAAPILAVFFVYRLRTPRTDFIVTPRPYPLEWLVTGAQSAVVQLLAFWFSAYLIQSTFAFSHMPVAQLFLFFCSMPRPAWLKAVFVSLQSSQKVELALAASILWGEVILQIFSSYYMIMTVRYGHAHTFYYNTMEKLNNEPSAKLMYLGAGLWLTIAIVSIVRFTLIVVDGVRHPAADSSRRKRETSTQWYSNIKSITSFNALYYDLEDALAQHLSRKLKESYLVFSARVQPAYGTMYPVRGGVCRLPRFYVRCALMAVVTLLVLWIAQWLFWVGFLGLSSSRFCFPSLIPINIIWIVAVLIGDWMGRL